MDFGLPFSFPFQDQNWFKKLAIAGLVMLIPFVGLIYVSGWGLEITKQIIRREPIVIPDTDFGKFLIRGLKVLVIGLVYSIPSIILQAPAQVSNFMAQTATSDDGSGAVLSGLAVVTLCTSVLNAIYGILLAFVMPAAYSLFMVNDEEIGAGFRFGEIFALLKRAPVAFLLVLIGGIIAFVIGWLVGFIACVVGLIVTLPYATLINSHFYGQAYLEATK